MLSMEEELRKECARLQSVNAALQSEMILKHAPLQDLHAARADKMAADAALARLAECVRGWAQRRGDAVPSELLQMPSNPEQVSAMFEYVKSGSRRHLAAACSPSNRRSSKQVSTGSSWPSPAASPVVDDEHVAGLRAQLVELEVRLKTQSTAHEQQLAAVSAEKQAVLDELSAKEKQFAERSKVDVAAHSAATEQLQRGKADAERRADEATIKLADAMAAVDKLQAQVGVKENEQAKLHEAAATAAATHIAELKSVRSKLEASEAQTTHLSQRLGQSEQQKSELAEQREIMQRALESSQKQSEQGKRRLEVLQDQLQQRHNIDKDLKSRVEASERDRAMLKSRLEMMARTIAGLETKLLELSRRTLRESSQPAAEDDSQTTQAVNDSQLTEGSQAQVQLLSASSPGLKPQPSDAKNKRKRAAPDGTAQPNKQVNRHSSHTRSDDPATRSPATLKQNATEAPRRTTLEQTAGSPANVSSVVTKPRDSKKRRSTRDSLGSDEPKPMVAMLSGFTSKEVLHGLEQQLEEMGVTIKRGNAFDKTISHVIAPAGQNTWKTIAGALAQRWVVHDGWVRESYHAFKQQQSTTAPGSAARQERPHFFMDENCYGNKKQTRIFNKKQFAFSGAFIAQHATKVALMKSVAAFGGGKVLSALKPWEAHASDDRSKVTHLFISDKESAEKGHGRHGGVVAAAEGADVSCLTYDEFVHWIGVWRRADSAAAKRARPHSAQPSPLPVA